MFLLLLLLLLLVRFTGLTDYFPSPSHACEEYALQQEYTGGAISPNVLYQAIEGHLLGQNTATQQPQR